MNKDLFSTLSGWPKGYITDVDLAASIRGSDATRYGLVNRALKEGIMAHVRRGVYLITLPNQKKTFDIFELAQVIYGPSYISLESSLQYHNLIPEEVYTVTSVTIKRSNEFSTPLGFFAYSKIPEKNFLLGVERVENRSGCFLIATPWRAIADLIYLKRKKWKNLKTMCEDMRFEKDDFMGDFDHALELSRKYPDNRTRIILKKLTGE